jgi:uncharacterized membrane protein (UPF0127 family)
MAGEQTLARVVDSERGAVVCESCELADRPWRRFRGLMGRRRLEPGHGLMLRPTNSIHTCFMRFDIDAVFLDREMHVVAVRERVRPWRAAAARGARAVLELPAGDARRRGVEAGHRLEIGGGQ